jgi:hypothetical protein
VGTSSGFGAAEPLSLGQTAFRIYLVQEALRKRRSGGTGRLARVVEGVHALGTPPKDERAAATWRRHARTVAAYRDRYGITATTPLGAPADNDVQKIDAARARIALDRAGALSRGRETTPGATRKTGFGGAGALTQTL